MGAIAVQTQNVVYDDNPEKGFEMLKSTGFSACDFSLNQYLKNTDIYNSKLNRFFDKSIEELIDYFTPHKSAAEKYSINIHQMHMPYPVMVPGVAPEINRYLFEQVAPKSMQICSFLECKYIVIHGFKLATILGSESLEWDEIARFIDSVAPYARENGITICIENLYNSVGGHLIEGPCCDADLAAKRIDYFNEKYGCAVLGFCLDTGHANLVGLEFEKFITTLGERLKVLHIHDNDGISDLHQIPFTFSKTRENNSSTDWASFVRGLKNIEFKGALSFETAPVLRAFPDEMKTDVLKFICQIGKYFSDEISNEKTRSFD